MHAVAAVSAGVLGTGEGPTRQPDLHKMVSTNCSRRSGFGAVAKHGGVSAFGRRTVELCGRNTEQAHCDSK